MVLKRVVSEVNPALAICDADMSLEGVANMVLVGDLEPHEAPSEQLYDEVFFFFFFLLLLVFSFLSLFSTISPFIRFEKWFMPSNLKMLLVQCSVVGQRGIQRESQSPTWQRCPPTLGASRSPSQNDVEVLVSQRTFSSSGRLCAHSFVELLSLSSPTM